MNRKRIYGLVDQNTGYVHRKREYESSTAINAHTGEVYSVSSAVKELAQKGSDLQRSPLVYILVREKRAYYPDDNFIRLSMREEVWCDLLANAHVLPSFLEVLHSNEAGQLAHVS